MYYEESENVELKSILSEDIKNEICAFLNSEGGTIYIGVDDNGKVIGINESNRDALDSTVFNWISTAFYPNPRTLISLSYNEDNVYVIKIKKGIEKPYYLLKYGLKPSGVYIRVGRSKRQAEPAEIKRLVVDGMNAFGQSYEDVVSSKQDLTFTDFAIFAKYNNLDIENKEITLGLKNTDGLYTNLGLLLSDQNPYVVKFAVYDDNLDFKVKKEYTGSIILICDQVLKFAEEYNITSAKIIPSQAQRVETKSYPGSSLRESLLNAFAHADYSWASNIKIEFFDDKCVITSPGGIFDGTFEEIMKGKQTYRNPKLVNILYRLNFIENYGTGLPRIVNAYKPYNKEVNWDITFNFFRVELPNLNYKNKSFNLSYSIKLNNVQENILNAIIKNPNITYVELAKIINKSEETIRRNIKILTENKILIRNGSKKEGYWEVINNH